jgi:hypothetical protein
LEETGLNAAKSSNPGLNKFQIETKRTVMGMRRRKIGDFYLVEQIGEGGMSCVYLGINPRSREKRAFKILEKRATLLTSMYGRFLREIEIIRDLSHPGIIKVFDNGVLEDCYYYSMEYMVGGNLIRRTERGRMPVNAALELFFPICEAMAYAHERGVIHRDLKPANILLNRAGEPVISDFGIAKVLDMEKTPLTRSGEILGTIAYLAPEQRFSTKMVNRRADVYALGAILYEMLMGFPPLGKFPWPKEVQPDFPEFLQSLLEKCLALDPENRFEHAGFLYDQMKKWPDRPSSKNLVYEAAPAVRQPISLDESLPAVKSDRIETWFKILRNGTTRERLASVREMVEKLTPGEAKTIVKLYAEEGDRVRWGLIRVLGELRIEAATQLILSDLNNSFHMECAIEALGKIGSAEAYNSILEFVSRHPESAMIALLPLARTGKHRAIKSLQRYLENDMAVLRQAAVVALASIQSVEALHVLRERLCVECDEKVRYALFQAVHSLQGTLLPSLTTIVQESGAGNARPF